MESNKAVAVKQFAIIDQPNPKFRNYMEDTSFVHDCFLENCPKSLLFGLFDGHGGKQVSNYLEKHLPQIIKDHYKKYKKDSSKMKQIFEESFSFVDQKIQGNIAKSQQQGSTGTVGLITLQNAKRVLYIAHVGDSTAYIFDDNFGEKLTEDHRGENRKQFQRVKESGGKIVNNRLLGILAVTRAFGDFVFKKDGLIVTPEVNKLQIRLSHKYIIVASDGLWDFVDIKETQKIIKTQIQASDISRLLLKKAIEKGSTDNITVMVIRL